MLAKVQGAKRKRVEVDEGMDVDGAESVEEAESEWMDVDGENDTPNKRAKSNTGEITRFSRRDPRTDRRLAGMRDQSVRIP